MVQFFGTGVSLDDIDFIKIFGLVFAGFLLLNTALRVPSASEIPWTMVEVSTGMLIKLLFFDEMLQLPTIDELAEVPNFKPAFVCKEKKGGISGYLFGGFVYNNFLIEELTDEEIREKETDDKCVREDVNVNKQLGASFGTKLIINSLNFVFSGISFIFSILFYFAFFYWLFFK